MPLRWSLACATALAVVAPICLAAQEPADSAARRAQAQPQDTSTACLGCIPRHPRFALIEALTINVLVNRYDAWIANQDWAMVGPDEWSRNLRLGWEWDEDEFLNNMFSHPYHGALYFNAGRSNGLGYWESAPLSFLGSATWEYFAESYRPSLNDFFMTSFGGIAIGETFHRVASTIRNNNARGTGRILREVATMPFDPVGGVNRLFRGEWKKIGPNPPQHDPGAYVFRVGGGYRQTADTGVADTSISSYAILADLSYGDRFDRPYRTPFDVFAVRAQISGEGGLNRLRISGRLYGRPINPNWVTNRHLFEINQRYDYLNNPAIKYGAQSIEFGIASRWRLSRRGTLRTDLFVDGNLMAALDAPYTGVGKRSYDFGPGAGARFDIAYEKDGITRVLLLNRSEYVHTVSGAEADHFVGLNALEITVPIYHRVGIGLYFSDYQRTSRYTNLPEERREYPEARIMLTLTTSGRTRSDQ